MAKTEGDPEETTAAGTGPSPATPAAANVARMLKALGRLPDRPSRVFAAVVVPSSVLLAVVPAWNALTGTFAWHVRQPQTTEGALELIVVFGLLLLAARLRARWFIPAAGAIAAMYLDLHHALAAAVFTWALFEIWMQIGGAVNRRLLHLPASVGVAHHLECFVTGFTTWALCVLVMSALGLGRFGDVRWITIVLGVSGALVARTKTLTQTVVHWLSGAPWALRALSLFGLWILVWQFARSVRTMDYDSIWYGLRPELVLVGDRSLFQDLGFGHYVYYYPKLLELLALPLSGFRQYSFVLAANIGVLGLVLLCVYRLGRELGSAPSVSLLFACAVGALPVVANMATVAKGDLLSCLWILLCSLFWSRALARRSFGHLMLGLAAGVLSIAAKLTALVYFSALVVGFAAAFLLERFARRRESAAATLEFSRGAALFAVGSAAVVLAIFARTYSITGIPTFPLLVGFWKRVGFEAVYPWTLYERAGSYVELALRPFSQIAERWYKYLIDPGEYSQCVIAWPGTTAAVVLPATLIAAYLSVHGRRPRLPLYLIAVAPVVFVGAVYATFGHFWENQGEGDGNYFMVPVVLALLGACATLIVVQAHLRSILTLCLGILTVGQLPIGFVSHWSWEPGTAPFSLDWTRPLPDADGRRRERLEFAGAWELEEYLSRDPGAPRPCAGYGRAREGGQAISEEHLRNLSCRFEDFESLEGAFPNVLKTEENLRTYLIHRKKAVLILPNDATQWAPAPPFVGMFERLAQYRGVKSIRSRNYRLIDLGPAWLEALKSLETPASPGEGTAAVTPVAPASATISGTIEATPDPIVVCDGSGLGQATLVWTVSKPEHQVEVRVDSADGPLFTSAQTSGRQQTPKWVRDKMAFYLVQVVGGSRITLARDEARVVDKPCPAR